MEWNHGSHFHLNVDTAGKTLCKVLCMNGPLSFTCVIWCGVTKLILVWPELLQLKPKVLHPAKLSVLWNQSSWAPYEPTVCPRERHRWTFQTSFNEEGSESHCTGDSKRAFCFIILFLSYSGNGSRYEVRKPHCLISGHSLCHQKRFSSSSWDLSSLKAPSTSCLFFLHPCYPPIPDSSPSFEQAMPLLWNSHYFLTDNSCPGFCPQGNKFCSW